MALAAIAYARATDRRQVMVATSSVGPGALNMVTAAGLAHANRLPVLLLPGDTFTSRAPDPVLQQVEHFGDPSTSVNDSFRAVSRYFDRITRPEQLLSTSPRSHVCSPTRPTVDPSCWRFPRMPRLRSSTSRRPCSPRACTGSRANVLTATTWLTRWRRSAGRSDRCWSSAAGSATRGRLQRRWPSPRPTVCRSWRPSPAGHSSPMTTGSTAGRSASSVPPRRTSWLLRPMSSLLSAPDFRTSRRPPGRGSPQKYDWSRSTPRASMRSSTRRRP